MRAWLGRLKLSGRFALLGVVALFLLGPALVLTVYRTQADVAAALTERNGIEPVRAALRVVQLVQQHRGLAANVLGGETQAEPPRAAKQAEVDRAAGVFGATLRRAEASVTILSAWERAAAEWQSLAQGVAGRRMDGRQSFVRHTALVAEMLRILDLGADHFGLTVDPEANGQHLVRATLTHLPQLAETLGQARARGTLHLAQHAITPEERVALAALIDLVNMHRANMARSLDKALDANAIVRSQLGGVAMESATLARRAVDLARERIIEAPALAHSSTEYFSVFTQVIDGQYKLLDRALTALDLTLGERLDGARRAQVALLAFVGAGIVFGLWLGFAVARSILDPLGGEPEQAAAVAHRVAQGDLAVRVDVAPGDTHSLLHGMHVMREGLVDVVTEIQAAARAIDSAASQIAAGNADLSSRTEEQASTLEQTASSMEEMTATVRQNAESAGNARDLAASAADLAANSGQAMAHVVGTMDAIAESGQKIADIVGVIDGIAFQTNILALNAAVEAARAGEQGRGFAVVASEVRALAQRSAAAAKEIRTLIQTAVARVGEGNQNVEQAGESIAEVVSVVKRVSEAVKDIATASGEQLSGIEQVARAVAQMDQAVQQNAALVEESTAATESMAGQAKGLVSAVARFRVESDADHRDGEAASPSAARESAVRRRQSALTGSRPGSGARLPAPPRDARGS